MKTNLKSKRNIPAVAYLSQDRFLLSVFIEDQFQLIRRSIAEYSDFDLSLEEKPFEVRKNTKLAIIVANQLVLYSQLKLPIKLSKFEISELISFQLSQRQQGSKISTYYDYFPLRELEDSALYGLFEARKDKLDAIIQALQKRGFDISLIIPQSLVVVNQIIQNNNLTAKRYQIVSRVNNQILVAKIDNEKLFGITQLNINQNQAEALAYPEVVTQLNEFDSNLVISVGLNAENLNQYLSDTGFMLTNFESLSSISDMAQITINWMREQYGHYKPVAMA